MACKRMLCMVLTLLMVGAPGMAGARSAASPNAGIEPSGSDLHLAGIIERVLAIAAKDPALAEVGEKNCDSRKHEPQRLDVLAEMLRQKAQELERSEKSNEEVRDGAITSAVETLNRVRRGAARYIRERMSYADVAHLSRLVRADERFRTYLAATQDAREVLVSCVEHEVRVACLRTERTWRNYSKSDFADEMRRSARRMMSLDYEGGPYDEFFEATYAVLMSENAFVYFLLPLSLGFDIVMLPLVGLHKLVHWLAEE